MRLELGMKLRGYVRSKAAPSLRSIESQPSTQRFVKKKKKKKNFKKKGEMKLSISY